MAWMVLLGRPRRWCSSAMLQSGRPSLKSDRIAIARSIAGTRLISLIVVRVQAFNTLNARSPANSIGRVRALVKREAFSGLDEEYAFSCILTSDHICDIHNNISVANSY